MPHTTAADMSALYVMRYVGESSTGAGALHIGKGVVVGVDTGNIRYRGTYTQSAGRLRADVAMTAAAGGSTLVTGAPLAVGQSLQITADWPEDFANGTTQQISVGGRQVSVMFEKVGDIP